MALLCAAVGCGNPSSPKRIVVWDFSQSRDVERLSDGRWTPDKPGKPDAHYVYYVKGDRNLMLSIVLSDQREFNFDSVNHVYVTKQGNEVKTIDVASFGYSEEQVIEKLTDMHQRWNGGGIANVEAWQRDIANGSLRRHNTEIQRPTGPDDAWVTAAILYNFGGSNDRWFVMVTFFWGDLGVGP